MMNVIILLFRDTAIVLVTSRPGYLEMMDAADSVGFSLELGLPSTFPQGCCELLLRYVQLVCGASSPTSSRSPA